MELFGGRALQTEETTNSNTLKQKTAVCVCSNIERSTEWLEGRT